MLIPDFPTRTCDGSRARPLANYLPIDFESEIDRIVCSARDSGRLQTGQAAIGRPVHEMGTLIIGCTFFFVSEVIGPSLDCSVHVGTLECWHGFFFLADEAADSVACTEDADPVARFLANYQGSSVFQLYIQMVLQGGYKDC